MINNKNPYVYQKGAFKTVKQFKNNKAILLFTLHSNPHGLMASPPRSFPVLWIAGLLGASCRLAKKSLSGRRSAE